MARILIVLTSHTKVGSTEKKTGFYFDEMATPYWALVDAGHEITIASIAGGHPEYDPSSVKDDPLERPEPVARFLGDSQAMALLSKTARIDDVSPVDFDGIFLAGGHGTMFDFPKSEALATVVGKTFDAGGIIGAVCHGPAGLVAARRADGRPVVEGLRVNAFTDAEEQAVGLVEVMPFLLESRLRELGAKFEGTDNFKGHAVRDGQLITGQNPASAALVAEKMLEALVEKEHTATA